MSALATQLTILNSLESHRSRSSAAAIGHQFVLNGAPPKVQVRGIDALANMICDWSVAILEDVIDDKLRNYLVRQYAIRRVGDLVTKAVGNGYRGISLAGVQRLVGQAMAALFQSGRVCDENQPAHDLCSHLGEAIESGVFDELPDF